MRKLTIVAISFLVVLQFAVIVGGYITTRQAREVCKIQNTYMVDGTTYLCENKQ